jgi:hypothetical protein
LPVRSIGYAMVPLNKADAALERAYL